MTAPPITRAQVTILLARYCTPDTRPPSTAVIDAWTKGLAGYSFGECEAALIALGPQARTATPSIITGTVDNARTRSDSPTPQPAEPVRWQRETARIRHREAGWRGIHAVYQTMGWTREPGIDQARLRRCPFCKAASGVLCSPLSRDRAGRYEARDPATRMHPSRLTPTHDLETTR